MDLVLRHTDQIYIIVTIMGVTVFTPLTNDFKIVNHDSAEIQTHALAASKFEYERHLCSLMLGLPMSLDKISLFVYLAFDGKLSAIKICSMSYTGDQLPRLLCVVYAAIISLATKHITTGAPKLVTVKCVLSGNCVVCVEKRQIVKYYDSLHKPYLIPNADLYAAENVQLQHMCNNGIAILKYDYIEGTHLPQNLRGIVNVLKNLDKIHQKGFVHGSMGTSECLI